MNPFSHGAIESPKDYRTIIAKATGDLPASAAKVELSVPSTDDLCNQRKCGICTACTVRMMAESHFKDGVRLSEYWLYLIGKMTVENGALYEGSAISYMLKAANKSGIPDQSMEARYPLKVDGTYADFIASFRQGYGGKIPQEVMDNARLHVIPGYSQIPASPVALASEIAQGRLLGFMLVVGDNTYTDSRGNVTWDADYLLPWRAPRNIDGGHAIAMNEYLGLGDDQEWRGPQSWSRKYCGGNPYGAGYVRWLLSTQKPYIREAWSIISPSPEAIEEIRNLPAPAYPTWYQKFLSLLKLNGIRYDQKIGHWVYIQAN